MLEHCVHHDVCQMTFTKMIVTVTVKFREEETDNDFIEKEKMILIGVVE